MSDCEATVVGSPTTITGEVTGTFRPAGLTVKGVLKETSVPDNAWVKIPTVPEPNRNALSIQNQHATIQFKINYVDLGASYIGVLMNPGGERFYQITDTIEIWAKASSGSGGLTVLTEELV